jgi:membrane protease YdiL (CAAX protease family)
MTGLMENISNSGEKVVPQEKHQIWRYFVTIFLVVVLMLLTQLLLLMIAVLLEGDLDINSYDQLTLLWVTMLPFAAGLAGLLLCVRFIHKIPLKPFFTKKAKFQWKFLLISAAVWFVLAALTDLFLGLIQPGNYEFTFNPSAFFPFLILTILLVPIQISAEEFFFRGYLQPGFTRLTGIWWVGLILQAVLFGLLHGANTEVTVYGVLTTMPFYIGVGLLLGLIVQKFRGLEEALGLHLANNIYASVAVTFSGSSIPSPALFTIKDYHPILSLILFFVTAAVYYFVMQWFHRQNRGNQLSGDEDFDKV